MSDSDSDIQCRVVAIVLEQSKKTRKPMSDSDKEAKRAILAAARAKRAVIAESGREAAALKESEIAVLRAQVEEEERKKFVKKVRRDLRAAATAKAPAPAPVTAPPLPAPVARHSWTFA
jgi:hydroxypyruvate isomerase